MSPKKNREVNIFNISFLDVLSCALGAVLVVMIIAMSQARTCPECPVCPPPVTCPDPTPCPPCPTPPPACPECPDCEAMNKTFLLIYISWNKTADKVDIDLHVTDPLGRRCYFKDKKFTNPDMELIFDYTEGGGIEAIFVPEATKGNWKIEYHYYAGNSSVSVKGLIRANSKIISLGTKTMSPPAKGPRKLVATFTVVGGGRIENFQLQ